MQLPCSTKLKINTMPATEHLAYALGKPEVSGVIRSQLEDFQVDEELGFELTSEGEHVCLHIRKRNANTDFIAKQIARLADVKNMDVSYAGLKDRHAVTTQWFSVYLSSKPEPDWSQLSSDEVEVLEVTRHNRKLRRGSLKGNYFKLVVRDLQGDSSSLKQRLQTISSMGVPNYFGEQRFGRDNLAKATGLFNAEFKVKDRNKRSMYLSAARSAIFNEVLSRRVAAANWNQALAGDVMMLDGSHSVFLVESLDDEIKRRVADFDIHPTGPLWGRGRLASTADAQQLEQQCAGNFTLFCDGLEKAGMKQERRALRLPASNIEWQLDDNSLSLSFFLSSGSYATSVLREVVHCR